MDKIETTAGALPRAIEELHKPIQDAHGQYTPGDFLKQSGMCIAVCLGLAMVAEVLVMIVGQY